MKELVVSPTLDQQAQVGALPGIGEGALDRLLATFVEPLPPLGKAMGV